MIKKEKFSSFEDLRDIKAIPLIVKLSCALGYELTLRRVSLSVCVSGGDKNNWQVTWKAIKNVF